MERKLATIEKIERVRPHGNADSLELVTIRGWQVVTRIGDFKEGDLCVYCEIDSLMPEREEFEFLRPRKFRIKTTKLRGQVSQGIAFSLENVFHQDMIVRHLDGTPDVLDYDQNKPAIKIEPGLNVTDILGVIKFEAPIPACLSGVAAGRFFSHSIKTDEERIQNLTELFPEYHDNYTWTATEKLDGSSCTYTIYEDIFGVASRNLALTENEGNSFWKYAREMDIEGKMRSIMKGQGLKALTMQGELHGSGIQKNPYKLNNQEVRFFRVFDPVSYTFFPISDAIGVVGSVDLKFVPIIETNMTLPNTVEELILLADGDSALYPTPREGIVFVAESVIDEINARPLKDYQGRLSFKVISNKYLLNEK